MEFKEHLLKYLDEAFVDELISTFDKKEHKGLILNTNKMSDEKFKELFPDVIKHPIVPHCFLYDQDKYEFGKSIYHDLGCFYIQDPSASLVSYFLSPKMHSDVLDYCAAPGGKSIEASLLLEETGIIYSNDISQSRANILLSNVERLGLGNIVVSSLDLTKVRNLEERFDYIILDAPCSGSGMFRKDSEMKKDWTYQKVLKQAEIQKKLIKHAYSLLKKGGCLIYSTCSYSFEEDEEVVEYLLLNSDAKLVELPSYEGFYKSTKFPETIHLFPNLFCGEGHYIALIKKPGVLSINENNCQYLLTRKSIGKGLKPIIYNFSLPKEPIKHLIDSSIRPGLLTTYEIANKGYISHHYSHYLDSTQSYKLSDEELKKYLHGETLNVKENKNYALVSYDSLNVGAVYQVNNVLKNLYPKGLRR